MKKIIIILSILNITLLADICNLELETEYEKNYYGCILTTPLKQALIKYYYLINSNEEKIDNTIKKHYSIYKNYFIPTIKNIKEFEKEYKVKKDDNSNIKKSNNIVYTKEFIEKYYSIEDKSKVQKQISNEAIKKDDNSNIKKSSINNNLKEDTRNKNNNSSKNNKNFNTIEKKDSVNQNNSSKNNKNFNTIEKKDSVNQNNKDTNKEYNENSLKNISKEEAKQILQSEYQKFSGFYGNKDEYINSCIINEKLSNEKCSCSADIFFKEFSEKERKYLPVLFYIEEKNIYNRMNKEKEFSKLDKNEIYLKNKYLKISSQSMKKCSQF